MKLKEYIKGLQKLIENDSETAEMEVVTSSIDDKGNGYWLELVGFHEKENKESPALEDCNAIIINQYEREST